MKLKEIEKLNGSWFSNKTPRNKAESKFITRFNEMTEHQWTNVWA